MNDLWISHYSVRDWSQACAWDQYIASVESLLGASLTHLDVNDPIKRKVVPTRAGEYIVGFGQKEDSRWLFGSMRELGVSLTIRHFKNVGHYPNSVQWYIPHTIARRIGPEKVAAIFRVGTEHLGPFYGYADLKDAIAARKKSSGAVNIQAELIGAFWLFSLGREYVEYFGIEKIRTIPRASILENGQAIIRISDSFDDCSESDRQKVEALLGAQSFVNSQDFTPKQPGRYALTFKQLRAFLL